MYSQWQVAMNDDVVLIKQLDDLKEQHRKLDEEISNVDVGFQGEMQLARLKKRKLQLRDMIATLEAEIYPDVPA